jgi:hypothetical protein
VTYNFDPDRWYENQRRALDGKREQGELTDQDYQAGLDALERRYEDMASRLDKPFDLNGTSRSPGPPRQG